MSDPFLMEPFKKTEGGYEHFFLTGAHNLAPIEFLQDVADDIFYVNDQLFGGVEMLFYSAAINHNYNYKIAYHDYLSSKDEYNAGLKTPERSLYKYNIDFSTFSDHESKFKIGYNISLNTLLEEPFDGVEKMLNEKINTGVPEDYEEFKRKIIGQFNFGYEITKKQIVADYNMNSPYSLKDKSFDRSHFQYQPFKAFTSVDSSADKFREFISKTKL
jgi:hypothetical protein